MRNLLKIIIIIFTVITLVSIGCVLEASANVKFSNIEVYEIKDGTAKLKWATDQPTKGIVYFGNSPDNLDRYIGYSLYDHYHKTVLTGLQKNKTYYYKIVAIDKAQNKTEAFLQTFSTKGMKKLETTRPRFVEKKILQVISDAAALSWTTSEKTNATIYCGVDPDSLNKKAVYKSYDKKHELFIHKLKPETKYYLKIVAKDKSGNKASAFLVFNTHSRTKTAPDVTIYKIEPLSFDANMIFPRMAIVKFKTNLVAKSVIYYGSKSGKHKHKVNISTSRQLNHQIRLSDLEPSTTYYYKIKAHGSFHKKSTTTKEMSFTTRPLTKQFTDGSLVKGSDYKVYVISGNSKRWVKSADIFEKLGYKWDWIQTISGVLLNEYSEGKNISSAKSHPDGALIKYHDSDAVYLLENNKKRPFSSARAFLRRGYSWNKIIMVSKKEKYKTGDYL